MGMDKVRENRLRRMAQRQGRELTKSRRRDPLAQDYGSWTLDGVKMYSLNDVENALLVPDMTNRK